MGPRLIYSTVGLGAVLVLAGWFHRMRDSSEVISLQARTERLEAEPICPWRQPESDLHQFFPHATRYETENRILSGQRLELAARLKRTPTAGENVLRLYRVFQDDEILGTLLTGRVKGEYGAIEFVVAVNPAGEISGLRIQRQREPDEIARELQDPAWFKSFRGMTASSDWQLGSHIAEVAPPARKSAEALVEGVRSNLVLLDVSSQGVVVASRHH